MGTAQAYKTEILTAEEYLALENKAEFKNEFIRGRILAMAGASDSHVTVTGNIFYQFKSRLRGSGCRVYMLDMKVRVKEGEAFYPDVFVTCSGSDSSSEYFKKSPKFIAEVLSPSTEAYDRGQKFTYYREIESLEQYMLIDPSQLRVDIFTRKNEGRWELMSYTGMDTVIPLISLDTELKMSDIYEDITFTAEE